MVKRRQVVGLIAAALLLLVLALGPKALDWFRPPWGYRAALVAWIKPDTRFQVAIEDVRGRKADFVVDFYGVRYKGNTSNLIDADLYYYGAYEKPELYLMRETLRSLPQPVLIDVGANTGMYSLFAAQHAKEVHAFEPFPPILPRLRAHITENNISNIVVHAVGLGEAEAELPFYSPPEGNLGTGSFVPELKQGNRDEQLTLKVVAGDAYFPKAGITRVDFIKIDIEGYEKAALAGLRETLRRHRPIVLMELSIDPAFPHLFKSMAELRSAFPENYEFLSFGGRNVRTGSYWLQGPFETPFDRPMQFNIVARPVEKAALVPMNFAGEPGRP
jgi:FkbM family methyltransferase